MDAGVYSAKFQKAYFKNYELAPEKLDHYIVMSPMEYEFFLKSIVETKAQCEVVQ